MLYKFGDKDNFAIWIEYFKDIYKDDPVLIESPIRWGMGGQVHFWIKGLNIFQYKNFGPDATYGYDLNILFEYFCQNLIYHITSDPFPKLTKAINVIEKLDECAIKELRDDDLSRLHEVDWDSIDLRMSGKIFDWNCRHGWIAESGGSFLPLTYFCESNDKVEITWNSKKPYTLEDGSKLYFEHSKGVEYVDIKLYRDIVSEFCLHFLETFKEKINERMLENRAELQKALAVEL